MSTSPMFGLIPVLTSKTILIFIALLTVAMGIMGSGFMMITVFYITLAVWSFLLTFRLVIVSKQPKNQEAPAPKAAEAAQPESAPGKATTEALAVVEELAPPLVVPQPAPATPTLRTAHTAPPNLPVVGYSNLPATADTDKPTESKAGDVAYDLEEQAHKARVLLSADALRHFLATVPDGLVPTEVLAQVIETAKQRYPSEDGWVVLNEQRMGEVCIECLASAFPTPTNETPYTPTIVPEGTGSLAEMIASSNVGAAFALIGHRPMFALADAVADFDALYRSRKGEATHVSDLLVSSSAGLSDETLLHIITALTSALDGMYTSEAEAVKTAIMKAIKLRG